MTKPRQKRNNQETILALWSAFGELKTVALKSGKINDCSQTKVAAKVGLSKAYLFGNKKVKNEDFNQSLENLANEIERFRDDFKNSKILNKQKDLVQALQEENKNLKASFHKYFTKVHSANETANRLKQRVQELDARNLGLQKELYDLQLTHTPGKNLGVLSINRSSKVVIDIHSYKLRDENGFLSLDDAYFDAFDRLAKEMTKPYKKRLYVTVGLPGAGKSYWADTHQFPEDRHSIIFDALNLSRKDRRGIFQRVVTTRDLEIVWVAFMTQFDLIMQRNLELHSLSQQLSENEIRHFQNSFEFPDPQHETWIHHLYTYRGLDDY